MDVGQARKAFDDGRSQPFLTRLLAPLAPPPARSKHFCLSRVDLIPPAGRAASLRARSSSSGTRALAGSSHLPGADWLGANSFPHRIVRHPFRQGGGLGPSPMWCFFRESGGNKVTLGLYGRHVHSPGISPSWPRASACGNQTRIYVSSFFPWRPFLPPSLLPMLVIFKLLQLALCLRLRPLASCRIPFEKTTADGPRPRHGWDRACKQRGGREVDIHTFVRGGVLARWWDIYLSALFPLSR
jgi:hypothetical protein